MLKPFRLSVYAAMLASAMLITAPAFADKPVYSDLDSDGTVVELYVGGDGQVYAIIYHTDGSVSGTNPNPDGSGNGTGKPDYKDIIRRLAASKGGLPRSSKKSLYDTVLKGKGIVPLWNPADLGSKTGDTGAGGGGESAHDAAWAQGQANKGKSTVKKTDGNNNGAHGDGGDVNGHKAPDNSNGYTIKPEIVNPAPKAKK